MAITFIAAGTTGSASSGNVTPGLPSGWAAGDVHVCIITTRDNIDCTMPAGWSALSAGTNNGTIHRTKSFYRVAVAGDAAPTVTHTSGSDILAVILGFRGCIASPLGQNGTVSVNTASTTLTASAVTTGNANEALIFVAGQTNNAGTATVSGYSGTPTPAEVCDVTRGALSWISMCAAWSTISAAGTNTGSRTATSTRSGVNNGYQVTLIPVLDSLAMGAAPSASAAQSPSVVPGAVTKAMGTASSASAGQAVSVLPGGVIKAMNAAASAVAAGAGTIVAGAKSILMGAGTTVSVSPPMAIIAGTRVLAMLVSAVQSAAGAALAVPGVVALVMTQASSIAAAPGAGISSVVPVILSFAVAAMTAAAHAFGVIPGTWRVGCSAPAAVSEGPSLTVEPGGVAIGVGPGQMTAMARTTVVYSIYIVQAGVAAVVSALRALGVVPGARIIDLSVTTVASQGPDVNRIGGSYLVPSDRDRTQVTGGQDG